MTARRHTARAARQSLPLLGAAEIPGYTTDMSTHRNVLLIGLDPHAIPGFDAAIVDTAIAIGQQGFATHGIPADLCLVKPDARVDPDQRAIGVAEPTPLTAGDQVPELHDRDRRFAQRHRPEVAHRVP